MSSFQRVFVLVLLVFAGMTPVQTHAGGDPAGSLPVLIKSRVPLTPEVLSALSGHGARVTYVWPEIQALAMSVSPAGMEDLAADPSVAFVETDQQGWAEGGGLADAGATPPAPLQAIPLSGSGTPLQTWNQSMARTFGTGFDGTGVTVAVVDSGLPQNWPEFLPPGRVDLEHAAGFGAEGWGDFHNPGQGIRGVGGHVGLFPHGLAVSSVIVGFPSPLGPIGGAAPGVTILPVRVLNQFNSGWFSWFAAGILYVADLKASGALPGPVVINFSIQAHTDSAILKEAIDHAIDAGVLFVTIAGNFGPAPGSIAFPGRLEESITAGATGWYGIGSSPDWFLSAVPPDDPAQAYVSGFSGREIPGVPQASQIDVLAPGEWVFGEWLFGPGFSEGRRASSTDIDPFLFGTSFACPHVVGIVAQMLQKNPALTQAQAEGILRSTALPIPPRLPDWGADATGKGLVRGVTAVAATP
jgi:subtilisin family serine protease